MERMEEGTSIMAAVGLLKLLVSSTVYSYLGTRNDKEPEMTR